MSETDSGWPKYLSLAVHEFRTPATVIGGYLRMLLRDRAGPLAPNQRKLLEEIEKSSARISALLEEMSEFGQLLDGRQPLSASTTDLATLLKEVSESLPQTDDRPPVVVEPGGEALPVTGDPARLRRAIQSIIFALRREIIDGSELVVSAATRCRNGTPVARIVFGTPPITAALRAASHETLEPFDIWRGGCGLSLPLSREIVERHGGNLMALSPDAAHEASAGTEAALASDAAGAPPKQAGGVIELPLLQ